LEQDIIEWHSDLTPGCHWPGNLIQKPWFLLLESLAANFRVNCVLEWKKYWDRRRAENTWNVCVSRICSLFHLKNFLHMRIITLTYTKSCTWPNCHWTSVFFPWRQKESWRVL
jgi:hypothetical protein